MALLFEKYCPTISALRMARYTFRYLESLHSTTGPGTPQRLMQTSIIAFYYQNEQKPEKIILDIQNSSIGGSLIYYAKIS